MNYRFRFDFVDNMRPVANGITRQFAGMRSAARQFMNELSSGRSLAGLSRTSDMLKDMFVLDQVKGFAGQLMEMNDSLAISEAKIVGITRTTTSLKAARAEAQAISQATGMSIADATKGLSQMLPLAKGNVDAAGGMVKLAKALESIDPSQGFEGALFALKELESGDALSLRERFGFRVPSATEAAKIAKRDGTTVQEVMFAALNKQIDAMYGGGKKGQGIEFLAQINTNTIGGQMQRMGAAISNALLPVVQVVGPMVVNFFTKLSTFLTQNEGLVKKLVPPVLAVVGAFAGFAAISSIISVFTSVVAGMGVVIGIVTSPVTLIVAGIAALAAGVLYCWNNFKGFRGFLLGYFNTIKEFGKIMLERLITPFQVMGKLIAGIFTGDWAMVKSAAKDSLRMFDFKGDMERLGKAATAGYQKGVDAKPVKFNLGLGAGKGQKEKGIYSELGGKAYKGMQAAGEVDAKGAAKRSTADGSISGDGNGARNVSITIHKLVESINIHSSGPGESQSQIKEYVTRALFDAVNQYNYAQ